MSRRASTREATTRDTIVARTLGLPPQWQSTSLLTRQGIAGVTEERRMPQDGLLLGL